MRSFRRNSGRSSPFNWFMELLVIIAGITVSFILNEWREDKALQQKKDNLLTEVNYDLKQDSLLLTFSIDIYKKLLKAHDSLLINHQKDFNSDSLTAYIDAVVSYFPFQEKKKSHLKLMNDPELVLEKKDSLLERFLMLHGYNYHLLHEWIFIEKEFVVHQVLPYMDQNAPFFVAPKGRLFDGEVFYDLRKKDAFLNFIKSGKVYKTYILNLLKSNLKVVKKLKTELNKEVSG